VGNNFDLFPTTPGRGYFFLGIPYIVSYDFPLLHGLQETFLLTD